MVKKDYEAIAEVLSGPVRDRRDEIEHQDVYDEIGGYFADKLGEEFGNFDDDKFIDAT